MRLGLLFVLLFGCSFIINAQCTVGNTTLASETGASTPAGWVVDDQRSGYFLLTDDSGSAPAGESVITSAFDASSFTSISVSARVATFGSGTARSAVFEYSIDNGVTYSITTFTTATPSSSSYINSGIFTFSIPTGVTQLVIRFTRENGTGRDVRIQDLLICGSSVPACPIAFDLIGASYTCQTETTGSDNVTFTLPYTGSEPNLTFSVTPSVINTGDDPTTVANGNLIFTIVEGQSYLFNASSPDCGSIGPLPLGVSNNFCAPTPQVLITEIIDAADDSDERYIEICNRGSLTVDISGWTLERYANTATIAGENVTIPASTSLAPSECYLIIDNMSTYSTSNCVGASTIGSVQGNGDDPLQLLDANDNNIDIYGVIAGSSSGWNYENSRVVRNASVTDPNPAFTLSEWTITAGANFIVANPCIDDVATPVTLLSFEGSLNRSKQVELSWSTVRETENAYYAIERSANGRVFTQIGQITGAGTSEIELTYAFTDINPEGNVNYYRLRQVDFDGSTTFYGPIMIELDRKETGAPAVYPNPATNFINISSEMDDDTQVTLVSITGQVISSVQFGWTKTGNVGSIDVSQLKSGVYFLRFENGNELETVRFVKE